MNSKTKKVQCSAKRPVPIFATLRIAVCVADVVGISKTSRRDISSQDRLLKQMMSLQK